MPKLYEYFGLRVYFYANENEPVHIHGFYQGHERKALADFKLLISRKGDDIVRKWIEFFVHHRQIETEVITRKLK